MNDIIDILSEFQQYLVVQRDRASSTAYCYSRDVLNFTNSRIQNGDISDTIEISGEDIRSYLYYLKQKQLKNSTIKRRLIGVQNFWRFLYRTGRVDKPPITLDDLDIIIKRKRNPTHPLSPLKYIQLRKRITNELSYIH